MRGFGENANMQIPYSLSDYVQEVKDYMSSHDIIRPHVVAHSFGARVVVKALSQQPQLFDRVVITGGAGLKPRRTFKKVAKKLCFNLLKLFVKRESLAAFYSPDYLRLSPVMRQSFKMIVAEHLDDAAKTIPNRTLLIYGKGDKETPLYMARRFNKYLVNSKLLVIDGAGHFAFVDKPSKFNREVREFLLSN